MSTSFQDKLSIAKEVTDLQQDIWRGCRRLTFLFQGRSSWVVVPEHPLPGQPWLWRPTFFDAAPQADIRLLREGFHLAYTDVLDFYASPKGIRHGHDFHALLHGLGLNEKFTFVAISRGGLYALRYAEAYPGQVHAIHADAPVCDLRSWPAGLGSSPRDQGAWKQLVAAHGGDESGVIDVEFQPINRLKQLATHSIPMLNVCGDADEIVPYAENTAVLAERYRALGGEIEVILKAGVGHHPHGLTDPAPVVTFIKKHALKTD